MGTPRPHAPPFAAVIARGVAMGSLLGGIAGLCAGVLIFWVFSVIGAAVGAITGAASALLAALGMRLSPGHPRLGAAIGGALGSLAMLPLLSRSPYFSTIAVVITCIAVPVAALIASQQTIAFDAVGVSPVGWAALSIGAGLTIAAAAVPLFAQAAHPTFDPDDQCRHLEGRFERFEIPLLPPRATCVMSTGRVEFIDDQTVQLAALLGVGAFLIVALGLAVILGQRASVGRNRLPLVFGWWNLVVSALVGITCCIGAIERATT